MRVCTSCAAVAKPASSSPRVVAVSLEVGAQPRGEVRLVETTDVFGVDGVGLLLVEPCRVGVHVHDVERGDHLVEGEDVAVLGNPPQPSSAR